jgi:hypothetical protein
LENTVIFTPNFNVIALIKVTLKGRCKYLEELGDLRFMMIYSEEKQK